MAARGTESTRAMQERFETDFLATAASPFTATSATDGVPVNGFKHFVVSAEANNIFTLNHLIDMRLAFDKANVPASGRVFIVDPVVEATLNKKVTITQDVSPFGEAILRKGLASGQRFLGEWFGWTLIVSNRLYRGAANDGTTTLADGIFNLAMCVLDDQTKPLMAAWRRHPRVEGERNKDRRRDEFVTTARYGFGIQRIDTLGCVVTSPTATA